MLPSDHCALLRPKSIWSDDEKQETRAAVESILHLDPIDVCLLLRNRSVCILRALKLLAVHFGALSV